nr:thioesterase family protein [Endozoicomonas sp.]
MENTPVSASVTLQVPFHDVDMMCVAWHGHYVKYFEVARCALLDQIRYNYQEMKDSGYAWPVVDLKVKYVRPARFGQNIKVTCQLKEYENRLVLSYQITDPQTGQRLTKGETTQVAVNMSTGELQLVSPPVLLEKLGLAS